MRLRSKSLGANLSPSPISPSLQPSATSPAPVRREGSVDSTDSPSNESIDPTKLLERKEKQRAAIVKEIITTEVSYLSTLQSVIDEYLIPIRNQVKDGTTKFMVEGKQMNMEHVSIMFSNIEMIAGFNKNLLNELQQRYHSRQSYYVHVTVGIRTGIRNLKLTPFLKLYTEYSKNYNKCLEFLKKTGKHCKAFQNYLDNKREGGEHLGPPLDALLIQPIQRIPRYNLLLKDLIKNTSETHADYQYLNAAQTLMIQVAEHINESMKTSDNFKRLLEIENRFTKALPMNLIEPHRFLIKDGAVFEGTKKKWLFLFNDCLIFANLTLIGGYKFKCHSPIMHTYVSEATESKQPSFRLQTPSLIIILSTHKQQDKEDWIKAIIDAKEKQKVIEGSKIAFKLMQQEEDAQVLEAIKSKSQVVSPATSRRKGGSEMERILMEAKKMELIKEEQKKLELIREEQKKLEEEQKKMKEEQQRLQKLKEKLTQKPVSVPTIDKQITRHGSFDPELKRTASGKKLTSLSEHALETRKRSNSFQDRKTLEWKGSRLEKRGSRELKRLSNDASKPLVSMDKPSLTDTFEQLPEIKSVDEKVEQQQVPFDVLRPSVEMNKPSINDTFDVLPQLNNLQKQLQLQKISNQPPPSNEHASKGKEEEHTIPYVQMMEKLSWQQVSSMLDKIPWQQFAGKLEDIPWPQFSKMLEELSWQQFSKVLEDIPWQQFIHNIEDIPWHQYYRKMEKVVKETVSASPSLHSTIGNNPFCD